MAGPTTVGVLSALGATTAVGAAIAVSGLLVDYPVLTGQAARYALAAGVLALGARASGVPVLRPDRRAVPWLLALAATGLALFNVALVGALDHAEPAAVGVIVGCVPLVLAVSVPLLQGRWPGVGPVGAACAVVAGAALVQGAGRTDLTGLVLSTVALACEVAFTLLAVPVLPRLRPLSLSLHTCWLAAVMLAAAALLLDGRGALEAPGGKVVGALGFLAVVVTAGAFLLWYTAVDRLGAEVAGLFAGVIPVSAAAFGLFVGAGPFRLPVLAGSALVGVGISAGLATARTRAAGMGPAPVGTPLPDGGEPEP